MSNFSFLGSDYEIEKSLIQMELTANRLVFLLKHSGLSRAELARKLGWKKSRVSKVLSGDMNLTIKTITAISEALEYDFEVVFYNKDYPKPKQPWQIDRENKALTVEAIESEKQPVINIQSDDQVFHDLISGKGAGFYIPVRNKRMINVNTSNTTQTIARSIDPHYLSNGAHSTELPVAKFKSVKVMNHEQA